MRVWRGASSDETIVWARVVTIHDAGRLEFDRYLRPPRGVSRDLSAMRLPGRRVHLHRPQHSN